MRSKLGADIKWIDLTSIRAKPFCMVMAVENDQQVKQVLLTEYSAIYVDANNRATYSSREYFDENYRIIRRCQPGETMTFEEDSFSIPQM